MVYIGTRKYKYRRMIMSHMIADSLEELHDMAEILGVRRYFQNKKGKPHYDICQSKKKKALDNGAILVCDRKIVMILKEKYSDHAGGDV